jgi:hypothetical protein
LVLLVGTHKGSTAQRTLAIYDTAKSDAQSEKAGAWDIRADISGGGDLGDLH